MLGIIIVNYKNEQKTIEYVKKEVSKVTTPHKVIIVNNGATEESDEVLKKGLSGCIVKNDFDKKYPDNNCYILSNPLNSGFAQGNNWGALFAKQNFCPSHLLFSNNDVRFLSNDVVERLIEKLDSVPEVGIIGPKVIGLNGKLQSPEPFLSFWDRQIWMYLSTPFYSKEKKIKRFKLDYSQQAQEGVHYKVMGSFFVVKAKDFFTCGMMDPNTFLYAEETILTERMKRIGKKVYYYPEVSILHEHGATTKRHLQKRKQDNIAFQSECYYYRKYIGTSQFQIFIGKLFHVLLSLIKTR